MEKNSYYLEHLKIDKAQSKRAPEPEVEPETEPEPVPEPGEPEKPEPPPEDEPSHRERRKVASYRIFLRDVPAPLFVGKIGGLQCRIFH